MTDFLLETLVWTGALIALVLVLRRPVARWFGARTAYALWFLPLARLAMPPLVLPAWLGPAARPDALVPGGAAAPIPAAPALPEMPLPAMSAEAAMSVPATAPLAAPSMNWAAIDWAAILIAVWLVGAGVFLVRRFALYFRMRRELLAHARPVGEVGAIRIVETPAADGPVAFGVWDKVIALPMGMMGSRDRTARDLAIEHEIAHHRGQDLIVNFLVQPLFALHWFNPLGWAGWRAMRRDQEAACDARVVAARPREDRARYADTIARFATAARGSQRHAMAAPMACPVLGDKSIVHRLRSLSMSDISRRRRTAGRVMLAGAVVALPFTASISYAAQDAGPDEIDTAVEAELEVDGEAGGPAREIFAIRRVRGEGDEPGADGEREREVRIIRIDPDDAEDGAADSPPRVLRIERSRDGAEGEWTERRVYTQDGRELSAEERARLDKSMSELRARLQANGEKLRGLQRIRPPRIDEEDIQRQVRVAIESAQLEIPRIVYRCDGDGEVTRESVDETGRKTLVICQSAALGTARSAIANARRVVERDPTLTDEDRTEALSSLDEALRELDENR